MLFRFSFLAVSLNEDLECSQVRARKIFAILVMLFRFLLLAVLLDEDYVLWLSTIYEKK
jgi:hypothetical protein